MRVKKSVQLGLMATLLAMASGPVLASTTYQYDGAGQLVRAKHSNGWVVEYQYDDAGNRTNKLVTPNRAPNAISDFGSVREGQASTVNVLHNDEDPDDDELEIVSYTQGAEVSVWLTTDGKLGISAGTGTSGWDSFTYTIEDEFGNQDTASVNVTIVCVDNFGNLTFCGGGSEF